MLAMSNSKPTRAILLAAGYGTRLRPLTKSIPKCLVEIAGKPLLQHWLDILNKTECQSAIVNTHYLSEKVDSFLDAYESQMAIHRSFEKNLLGTAGTLINNLDFFNGATGLLIHADNMSAFDLSDFLSAHSQRPKSCILTMLVFETNDPRSCGVVEVDMSQRVTQFYEKVDNPPGNLANGAVYAFDAEFIEFIRTLPTKTSDFSTEVLPLLLGRIYTWKVRAPYIDIGTPNSLRLAQSIWGSSIQSDSLLQ